MPFSILPYELSTSTMKDIVIGFRPLRQGRELWPGDLGQRTPVQSIESQERRVKDDSNRRARSNQRKAGRRAKEIHDELNECHYRANSGGILI